MKMFISPDGKAVRFIISHENDPTTPEGTPTSPRSRPQRSKRSRGRPGGSKVYLGGTASVYKDMQEGANYDLLIAGIASLCLIFIIMLILTRSVVAAAVIVGTVGLSLGASFGMSILIWQHIPGYSVALDGDRDVGHHPVGRRFGLQPAAGVPVQGGVPRWGQHRDHPVDGGQRFCGDLGRVGVRVHHGVDGDQRSAGGGSGGLDGALGLLFDTLVVRSFMTPSIAAILGRWFWWPQRIRGGPSPAVASAAGGDRRSGVARRVDGKNCPTSGGATRRPRRKRLSGADRRATGNCSRTAPCPKANSRLAPRRMTVSEVRAEATERPHRGGDQRNRS